jgi:hypothetical protein
MKIFNAGKKVFIVLILSCIFLGTTLSYSKAQVQDGDFSGNDVNSYQCFNDDGDAFLPTGVRDSQGRFLCCKDGSTPVNEGCTGAATCVAPDGRMLATIDNNGNRIETPAPGAPGDPGCSAAVAGLRPPKLQLLEIWFVRILYVIWALVASLSVFFLVALGYRWMISRGDVTKITEIRQRIIYYFIGFILIFLAVPILSTIFRVLGINNSVQCYDVSMPGFQFFYQDLCTAPNLEYYCGIRFLNPNTSGLACSNPGEVYQCSASFLGIQPTFTCDPTRRIWIRSI